jgi:hypothetical protein
VSENAKTPGGVEKLAFTPKQLNWVIENVSGDRKIVAMVEL